MMSKYYFTVEETTSVKYSPAYMTDVSGTNVEMCFIVRFCKYGNIVQVSAPYYVRQSHTKLFFAMCYEPVRALLYLKHDDMDISDLAKKIVKFKDPVEVRWI